MTETTAAPPLTEQAMMAGLTDAAERLGFLCYHALYSPGSDRGYPDVTIVGHGAVLAFEVKGPRGRLTAEQSDWLGAFASAGVRAWVVTPDNYDDALWLIQHTHERRAR